MKLIVTCVLKCRCMDQCKDIQNKIVEIENEFAPDKRVVVFDVILSNENNQISIEGETSCPKAYRKLKDIDVINNIRLLPSDGLGGKSYGIVYNSVGTIHKEPKHSSGIVTQTLMGTLVRVLDRQRDWYRIQTPDRYIGWVCGSIVLVSEQEQTEYSNEQKIMVSSLYAQSYQQVDVDCGIVSDLVVGDVLVVKEDVANFYKVLYADGREAYVCKSDAKLLKNWYPMQTKDEVVSTAMQFLGIPYVWGGTSSKGLDCSGFTQLVYFLHDILLPRDASQQVNVGELVDDEADFDKLELGDLVFFGEKATSDMPREQVLHVGIYIGNHRFVHASDYVRINSFNPQDELYDDFNTNRYLRTKRILGDTSLQSVKEFIQP